MTTMTRREAAAHASAARWDNTTKAERRQITAKARAAMNRRTRMAWACLRAVEAADPDVTVAELRARLAEVE